MPGVTEDADAQEKWTPVPDPTARTQQQIERAITAERERTDGQLEVLRERLHGIDVATDLRLGGINEIPGQIDEKVAHLTGVVGVELARIAQQFVERDIRSEREARDNKVAVDAAFAAQKEAAAKQDESNAKAIDKSEKATTDSIAKLAELFASSNQALSDKIDDLRARIGTIESRTNGSYEATTRIQGGQQRVVSYLVAAAVLIGTVIAAFGAIAATR